MKQQTKGLSALVRRPSSQPSAEGRASMDEVGQTRLAVQRSET